MNTPRYQHVRFFALEVSEDFFLGAHRYYKSGFLLGRAVLDGRAIAVMPWARVRSTRPFGKVKPNPFPSNFTQLARGPGPILRVIPAAIEPVEGEEKPIV